MHYTGAMQSPRPELRLTTTRVAYFKKLITRQNHLCSEVRLCFDNDGLTMYGTSATDSVVLTLSIGKFFFEHYECTQPRLVRINIYHLYKIIIQFTYIFSKTQREQMMLTIGCICCLKPRTEQTNFTHVCIQQRKPACHCRENHWSNCLRHKVCKCTSTARC